jgi:hypothetical protein
MISAITSAVPTLAVAQPVTTSHPPSSKAKAAAVPTDTVKISSAASALMQEVTETSAQTAKEAGAGDIQAQKLLAKAAAARK